MRHAPLAAVILTIGLALLTADYMLKWRPNTRLVKIESLQTEHELRLLKLEQKK